MQQPIESNLTGRMTQANDESEGGHEDTDREFGIDELGNQ